jgi:ribosomal protein S18 acetylase RimI-like enzyme
MDLKVRAAGKDDVATIADFIEEIETFYASSEIQAREVRITQVEEALFGSPPMASALLVVTDPNRIVGFAAYSYLWPAAGATHSLFLKELFISEEFRRQGVGDLLMNELYAIARSRPGCSRVEWTTDTDNDMARSFYQKLGVSEHDGKIFYRKPVEH